MSGRSIKASGDLPGPGRFQRNSENALMEKKKSCSSCICCGDGSGKGFGSPWVAVNLDRDLEIWGEEGAEVYVGTNGTELVRYPGADASSMHASISNDGKVLVINRCSSGYSTEIFTVGQVSTVSETVANGSGNAYYALHCRHGDACSRSCY